MTSIEKNADGNWDLSVRHWEPKEYVNATVKGNPMFTVLSIVGLLIVAGGVVFFAEELPVEKETIFIGVAVVVGFRLIEFLMRQNRSGTKNFSKLVAGAGKAIGSGGTFVNVKNMLIGGSGSSPINRGVTVGTESIRARYIVNCAGGASDQIAAMIGDTSFKIKPRIGDYILLNRNQGHLARHTLFPCPDPVLGKGVLVQTTLWGTYCLCIWRL